MSTRWPEVSLGEILTPRQEKPSEEDLLSGRVRIVSKISFADGRIDFRPDGQTKTGMILVRPGDLLVSGINAYKGAIAIYDPEAEKPAAATIHYSAYAIRSDHGDSRFLWYLLRSNVFRHNLEGAVPGGIKSELKPSRLLRVPVPLPPLAEQRRLVAQIEELAPKIEEARRLRKESSAEATLLEVSVIDKVFQAAARTYGQAPLQQVCLSVTDGDHLTPSFTEQGVPFIFVGNVSSGRLHFRGCKYVSEEYFQTLDASRKPCKGDVLYSAVGATLGIPAIVDSDRDFCFQRHVAILKPDKSHLNSRLLWFMLRARTINELAWKSTTGSAQPTIPLRGIRVLPVPVPPLDEQARLVSYLDDLQARMDASRELQSETAAELDALLPSILDKAFKGDL